MRILAFDIEASSLNADFGVILTFGYKYVGRGTVRVLCLPPGPDLLRAERQLLQQIRPILLDTDVWLTHYGTRYDVPMINSRLLYHRLAPLPPLPHIDTWRVAKTQLKLHSNRLLAVQTHLQLPVSKNAIRPEAWLRALGGHRPSLRTIATHNRRDVLVLEAAYLRLRSVIRPHPTRSVFDPAAGCPTCGSPRLQRRGVHVTRTRTYHRYACQVCGTWSRQAADRLVTA